MCSPSKAKTHQLLYPRSASNPYQGEFTLLEAAEESARLCSHNTPADMLAELDGQLHGTWVESRLKVVIKSSSTAATGSTPTTATAGDAIGAGTAPAVPHIRIRHAQAESSAPSLSSTGTAPHVRLVLPGSAVSHGSADAGSAGLVAPVAKTPTLKLRFAAPAASAPLRVDDGALRNTGDSDDDDDVVDGDDSAAPTDVKVQHY